MNLISWLAAHSPLLYLTQSLWRDEVYSVLMASKPISYFVNHLNFEPPLYYILLHVWMKVLGTSEIAGRSLSLIAFAGAVVIVIFWSEKLFKNHWLSWWLPVFFFLNPMLLYYGVELRTYGWYIFWATLSLYAYSQKKWGLWIASTVLGFYTHTFMVIVPFAQTVHYVLTSKHKFSRTPFVRAGLIAALCMLPWIIKILLHVGELRSSWYFPVDLQLVKSVLGNLFVGYEGTPWYMWKYTRVLSLILLATSVLAYVSKKTRKESLLFLVQLYVPLAVVVGISFMKPFYVNRYMIPVTIAEIFVVGFSLYAIRNKTLQKIVAVLFLLFVLGFNFWYPDKHRKVDMRATFREVNALLTPTDVVIAHNPLVMFESMYYAKPGTRVFLLNPQHNTFPMFVGEGLVSQAQMLDEYPEFPYRGFLINQKGTFDVVYKETI